MPRVVGIRFKDSGKTYYFDPNGLEPLVQGEQVIVETARGPEIAKVAYAAREVPAADIPGELKVVMRRAEPSDFVRLTQLNQRQEDVLRRCNEKIREHDLPMQLVKAEYSFDGSRLTFYFTSEKRVDFRVLVRDLARTFRTRIELRQIGPRDEAKLLGGIGPCGRLLCCATFLPDYARVSIKMAKDQDLPLNPTKISGVCGRLLCCLSYEHEQYVQIKAELPKKGAWVQTPDGPGEVVAVNVVRETVHVLLSSSGMQEEYSPQQIGAATNQVAKLAQSRAEEGITPVPRSAARALSDDIDNPEVLEALAMLEEGSDLRAARLDLLESYTGEDEASDRPQSKKPSGSPAPPASRPERRNDPVRPMQRRPDRPQSGPPSSPARRNEPPLPPQRSGPPSPRRDEPPLPPQRSGPPSPRRDEPPSDSSNPLRRRRRKQ